MAIGNRYANTRRIPSDKWSPCSRKDPTQWTCICYCGEVQRGIYYDLFIEVLQLWKDKLYDLIVYIANTAGFMWDDSVQCVEMMLCELTCLSPSVSGGVQCRIEGEHTNVVVVVRKRLPYFFMAWLFHSFPLTKNGPGFIYFHKDYFCFTVDSLGRLALFSFLRCCVVSTGLNCLSSGENKKEKQARKVVDSANTR